MLKNWKVYGTTVNIRITRHSFKITRTRPNWSGNSNFFRHSWRSEKKNMSIVQCHHTLYRRNEVRKKPLLKINYLKACLEYVTKHLQKKLSSYTGKSYLIRWNQNRTYWFGFQHAWWRPNMAFDLTHIYITNYKLWGVNSIILWACFS